MVSDNSVPTMYREVRFRDSDTGEVRTRMEPLVIDSSPQRMREIRMIYERGPSPGQIAAELEQIGVVRKMSGNDSEIDPVLEGAKYVDRFRRQIADAYPFVAGAA